jgi:flavin reductase (DIM6/NTAB) family NADH-FMN oxidoreductase RutF
VLVCIGKDSSSHDRLVSGPGFAVSMLAADQEDVALRFAREPSEGRFEDVVWVPGASGDPILEGALAWLECSLDEVWRGGDHSILIGRVRASGLSARPALVFHRGRLSSTGE